MSMKRKQENKIFNIFKDQQSNNVKKYINNYKILYIRMNNNSKERKKCNKRKL